MVAIPNWSQLAFQDRTPLQSRTLQYSASPSIYLGSRRLPSAPTSNPTFRSRVGPPHNPGIFSKTKTRTHDGGCSMATAPQDHGSFLKPVLDPDGHAQPSNTEEMGNCVEALNSERYTLAALAACESTIASYLSKELNLVCTNVETAAKSPTV